MTTFFMTVNYFKFSRFCKYIFLAHEIAKLPSAREPFCKTSVSLTLRLYLVEFQIYPLEADVSLVAHRYQHGIWILKLRTLGSLKRHQKNSDAPAAQSRKFEMYQPLSSYPHLRKQIRVSLLHLLSWKLIFTALQHLSHKMLATDSGR